MSEIIDFVHQQGNERLDRAVTEYLKHVPDLQFLTRSQIKKWVEQGLVEVNGKPSSKAGMLVEKGDRIIVRYTVDAGGEITPFDFPLDILFEDSSLLVINKPPGISVHPGAGNRERTLVNALAAYLGENFVKLDITSARPGVVHRLDKDTSGVLVVARTLSAKASLGRQFSSKKAGRKYLALAMTTPRAKRLIDRHDEGIIVSGIARHPATKVKMAAVEEGKGKRAVTRWKVLERMTYAVLLDVTLDTGRTHQIRVHLEHSGSPIIGDRTYGNFAALPKPLKEASHAFGRQALHAYSLSFNHPESGERITVEARPPADFDALLQRFRTY